MLRSEILPALAVSIISDFCPNLTWYMDTQAAGLASLANSRGRLNVIGKDGGKHDIQSNNHIGITMAFALPLEAKPKADS